MAARAQIDALLSIISQATADAVTEYEQFNGEVPSPDANVLHPLDRANSVPLKKAVRLLQGACHQLCAILSPPGDTVINLAQYFDWTCLSVVIRARIPDLLQDHPDGLHVRILSQTVHIEQGKLARILRLLATRGIFTEVAIDTFANNRLSLTLLSNAEANISALAQIYAIDSSKAAIVLYDNLTDPETANSYDSTKSPVMYAHRDEGINGTFFDWMERHNFGLGMTGITSVTGSLGVMNVFPWHRYKTFCDVGSGIGAFSMPLARHFPHMRLTLQDRPDTMTQACEVWSKGYPEALEASRIEFVPINFLGESPVAGQDVYFMRNIMHNLPDREAMLILRNIRRAMAPHSRLLVQDYVLHHLNRDEEQRKKAAALGLELAPEPMLPNYGVGSIRMHEQDIVMLLQHNAKERTLPEFVDFGLSAGLKLERVWDIAELCMLEFTVAA